MAAEQLKLEVLALKPGMFVSKLDCPWHQTPFPLQGFYIKGQDDIDQLKRYCRQVYIDVQKARIKMTYPEHATPDGKQEGIAFTRPKKAVSSEPLKLPPIAIKSPVSYATTQSIVKEVAKAERLHRQVYEAIDRVYTMVQCGTEIDVAETREVAEGMVESVIRNPDALVWLAKMHEVDGYGYQHSVKCAIWALVFGRHLGLDRKALNLLAMGALLAQVGKCRLPQELLSIAPEQMDPVQFAEYESYVQHSIDILEANADISKGVLAIAEYHKERHNGSGFPKGITGDQIPLLAKIVGLVDHYQSTIAPIDKTQGLSPLDAVARLYEQRNILFQQDLVEIFIQAVGVYPTGTLVELSSNEVAIVMGHNMERRLQPKIMVVLDENKQPLKHGKLLDLMEWNNRQAGRQALFIKQSLPKGAFDIDENQYLVTGATSKWSLRHLTAALATG